VNLKDEVLARLRSFVNAGRGVALVVRTQHNAWIHWLATVLVTIAGLLVGLSRIEWALVVLAFVAVWAAEALNTAFEHLCDVASPDFHPLVERAKDAAAGAVLLAAIGAVIVGALVFLPHFFGAA
jgi:diacylglycerol kinase (ATP)